MSAGHRRGITPSRNSFSVPGPVGPVAHNPPTPPPYPTLSPLSLPLFPKAVDVVAAVTLGMDPILATILYLRESDVRSKFSHKTKKRDQ